MNALKPWSKPLVAIVAATALVVPPISSAPAAQVAAKSEAWLRTLDDGLAAAKKGGRPVLVVTAWTNEL